MQTYIIVRDIVGYTPYWAIDTSLPKVRTRFKRLTGKYPSAKASIVALTGSVEQLDKISVNDLGDLTYPKELLKLEIQ